MIQTDRQTDRMTDLMHDKREREREEGREIVDQEVFSLRPSEEETETSWATCFCFSPKAGGQFERRAENVPLHACMQASTLASAGTYVSSTYVRCSHCLDFWSDLNLYEIEEERKNWILCIFSLTKWWPKWNERLVGAMHAERKYSEIPVLTMNACMHACTVCLSVCLKSKRK